MHIKKVVREFALQELGDNGFHEGIQDDDSLIDEAIMDSLGILIVISFLEEKFGIIVDEFELNPESFKSISAINRFIENKISKD